MQAIAPVVATLAGTGLVELATYATRESLPVTQELRLHATLLEAHGFTDNPVKCLEALFDTHRPDVVLSGTSPARGEAPETPEQFAILEARRRGVHSVAVQDYWGMYAERFARNGRCPDTELLPDRFCVLDRRAWADLELFGISADRMAVTHNPWLDRLVSIAARGGAEAHEPGSEKVKVLFASQPLAEMQSVRGWHYDQYELFETLLKAMPHTWDGYQGATLLVLPHPREDVTRWDQVIADRAERDVEIVLCRAWDFALLRDADYLVTSHSTLAYEALYFGTPCISLRPGTGSSLRLWVEEAGLSHGFQDADSLQDYFATSNPASERRRVLARKQELIGAGLFFSDGQATARVVREVFDLLGIQAGIKGLGRHDDKK